MKNRGCEFLVGYRNKTRFGLNYDITANISGFRNKVTYLPEDVQNSYGGRAGDNILGHPYGSFYGYVADGIFKTQEDVDNHVAQDGKAVGRIRYKDVYEEDGEKRNQFDGPNLDRQPLSRLFLRVEHQHRI